MRTRPFVIFEPASGTPLRTRGGGMVALGATRGPGAPKVHVDEISDERARELARQGKPTAPVFPMRLVRPLSERAVQGPVQTPWGLEAIGALASPCTGAGAKVAILDSGIDLAHPAFAHLAGRIKYRNFAPDRGETDMHDGIGHGTHCAGTAFGGTVDGVRIGVAPGVDQALIGRVFDDEGACDTAQVISAIQWAAQEGANVISMSLGINFVAYKENLEYSGMPSDVATSYALQGYLQNAQLFRDVAEFLRSNAVRNGHAVVLVAAAGNDSRRDDDASYGIVVGPPAAGDGVVSVGALTRKGADYAVASFSNTGPTVSAPGTDILSASAGGGLVEKSGTSMAAPHVAGMAALWYERWKQTGQLNAQTFAGNLGIQARPMPGGSVEVGSGMIQAPP